MQRWTEEQFASSRQAWQGLLERCDADPLFMSWDWQWNWWRHHAGYLRATLCVLALYSASGELVGLAPFYSHRVRLRGPLYTRRLELIGLAWRRREVVFSEYLDLLAAPEQAETVLAAVEEWLCAERGWHEMLLCCTRERSLARRLTGGRLGGGSLVREVDPLRGYRVSLPANFEEYLRALPAATRRKAFHQRRKLSGAALVEAQPRQASEYLDALAAFVANRWGGRGDGSGVESELQRRFHLDLAAHFAGAGCLQLTRLEAADGQALSVMYNVRAGATEYYLQSGFDAERSRGLSLGYLHLGYAIEGACAAGMVSFDFLGGEGRHRDYKRDFCTESYLLVSYHLIRTHWLRILYGGYLALKRGGGGPHPDPPPPADRL